MKHILAAHAAMRARVEAPPFAPSLGAFVDQKATEHGSAPVWRFVEPPDTSPLGDLSYTGLAAAWWWDGFANFRTTAVFVDSWSDGLLRDAGFVDEPRGANLWLVTPDDAGVFHGASQRDGVPVVHPVQAYLDLGAQAERAAEAAEHLRAHVLSERWGQRA